MQRYYTITQLTQEFDITTRTLRFYEAQGLVSPTRRGRQRLYTPGDRTRIKLILRGKRLGFSLNEIKEMIEMYGSAPGETGQLRLLLDRIAARRAELLEKQRDIELTLVELDDVEAGAKARMVELETGADQLSGAVANSEDK
ncbi:MerR family transcriptional regulator [Roseibium aggregatum]|uniref:MerR family transcriptional regulator n=1 Tax=Roseibium aggregatum TaxID=187304 RepID=UPI001E65C142|nr:MerR family DNA-binding transcriptional regulator [Roseibium aggregatum]MEC9403907.1 MerR family DNA-binding transcriptional regulator [Pseudomonadota bacterium]MEC9472818.1 MerR family DNA-binding transcriptional regulator [Pseudomonadota bacterium]MEE2867879.1 MerR family DNA-binding transcriptional regulator [Pseudomonadota bacterium]UES40131.1 MerR family transcriptional regulator [Roseibium aggregatum]